MRSLVWLAGGMRGMTLEGYKSVSVACVWLTFPDEPTSTPPARGFEYRNRVDLCHLEVHHINVRVRSRFLTASRSRREFCTPTCSYRPASPSIDTICTRGLRPSHHTTFRSNPSSSSAQHSTQHQHLVLTSPLPFV